jgi:sec-independent protein translocase protein TatC
MSNIESKKIDTEQEYFDSEKPLIDHIRELRSMFLKCFIFLILGFCFSYIFVEDIYSFLVQPLADQFDSQEDRKMIFTGLAEAFFTYLKLSLFAGFILSFPLIAWQIYKFIAPGLYKNEKKFFIPFLFLSPILFLLGAFFVYYFLFPLAWNFFLSFEIPQGSGSSLPIKLEARVSEYLSLVTSLILAFGITFQLPIIIMLLIKTSILDIAQLKAFRKYAVVVILIVAAILTPPDIISQIALAVPLFLLYEMSIFLSKFIRSDSKNA